MNYDSIIMEMLSRIQALEEKVAVLSAAVGENGTQEDKGSQKKESRMTTADIKAYIEDLLNEAKAAGNDNTVIVARDVHQQLGLKKRYPMVCNAMRQCMGPSDRIIYSPASGYSSTLEIEYKLF